MTLDVACRLIARTGLVAGSPLKCHNACSGLCGYLCLVTGGLGLEAAAHSRPFVQGCLGQSQGGPTSCSFQGGAGDGIFTPCLLPSAQAEGREDAAYFESLSAFVSKVRGERFGWEQARDMTFKDIAKNVEAYHNMLTRWAFLETKP